MAFLRRYDELDSMRGIAALSVILSHGLAIFAQPSNYLDITPFYFFWASHEAVIFFFVLSGFVLSLPYHSRKVSYTNYLVKRILRIYVPYMVAILFTFLMFYLFASSGRLEGLGEWISNKWDGKMKLIDFINHLFLIGNYETTTYNPVIWSLIHELRISIVFPLIIFILVRYPQKYILMIGIVLSLIGGLNKIFDFQESKGYHTSFFDSLHYTFMFIIGAVLAKNKDYLINKFHQISKSLKIGLLFLGLTAYLYSRMVFLIPYKLGFIELSNFLIGISDWGISVGAAILIIVVLGSKKLSNVMKTKFFIINGRLSYSTYLYHTTLLLTFFNIFNGDLSNWFIFFIAILFTYLLAYFSWRYVEQWSINLGKMMTKKINKPVMKDNKYHSQ